MSDIKNNMKELRSQVSTWQKSTEGNRRATLLTKHNKHRNQLANGENVSNAPTPAEHNEFEKLHQKWLDIKKPCDDATKKQAAISIKLESFRRERKIDPTSECDRFGFFFLRPTEIVTWRVICLN